MKKKIIKISKLSILLLIRQLWTTLCNLYLLVSEPFLTVRRIRIKRDKSQVFILISIFLSPVFAYVMARLITDLWWYKRLLPSVGMVFGAIFLIEMLVLSYMFYWTYQVISKSRFRDFREKI